MDTNISTFKDRKHTILRIVEALGGTLFLSFVTLIVPLEEAGYIAIPIILIPTALMMDGIVRFMVLKDGMVIDKEKDRLTYPKNYSRKSLKLSEITSVYGSKTLHTGAQLGTTTYTYDIRLQGSFGKETIFFSSDKTRDAVLKSIKALLPTKQDP